MCFLHCFLYAHLSCFSNLLALCFLYDFSICFPYGHLPKPSVYEVSLRRGCAGGWCATFCAYEGFQCFSFVISPRGHPRPPRRHPEGCARGAPTSFRICLSSPFCCLRCESTRRHYNNQHVYKEKQMKTKENQIEILIPNEHKFASTP